MTLTQDQRDVICKAYEVATDIKEYGATLGLTVTFIIDEDFWVRASYPKGGDVVHTDIFLNFLGVAAVPQDIAYFGELFKKVIKNEVRHE